MTRHLHNRRLKHIQIHSESQGQSDVDPKGPRLMKLCLEWDDLLTFLSATAKSRVDESNAVKYGRKGTTIQFHAHLWRIDNYLDIS